MTEIALPGYKIAQNPKPTPGAFIEDNATYAAAIGVMRDGKFIPLKGYYIPIPGDYVIGVVTDEFFNSYALDLNSPYEGSISTREIREAFAVGDVVGAKIMEANEVHDAVLGEPRKLSGGRMIEVGHVKVPRIIGRNASMVDMIKEHTGTDVSVGKNGRIYLLGGNIALAVQAVRKIDAESHTRGLTDRMKEYLEKNARTPVTN